MNDEKSFFQKIGVLPKVAAFAILVAVAWHYQDNILPMRKIREAVAPKQIALSTDEVGINKTDGVKVVLPSHPRSRPHSRGPAQPRYSLHNVCESRSWTEKYFARG